MKIWIISSDIFIRDFEQITNKWPSSDDLHLMPISQYKNNLSGLKNFYRNFKKEPPDVIISDHGHIAFFLLRILKLLRVTKVKIYTFLRGNYWLERKNYSKESKAKITFNLKATTKNDIKLKLIQSNNTIRNYNQRILRNKIVTYIYNDLLPNEHKLRITKQNKKVQEIRYLPFKKGFNNDELILNSYTSPREVSVLQKIKKSLWLFVSDLGWKQLFKASCAIIPVCNYLAEETKKHLKKPTITCPIGADPTDAEPRGIKLKHPAVIIIQNHQIAEKSKALVDFVPVIKELEDINFYISLGKPENRDNENFKRVIQTYEDFKNVFFVDINSENRDSYLKSGDVYALISGLDCTPATIIEASFMSKPILASRVGGVPEMILEGKTGWTIQNKNQKEWINKIKLLTSNKDLAKKMGENAKKHALKNYTTAVIAKKLSNIIKSN